MPTGHLATLGLLERGARSPAELAEADHVTRSVITQRLVDLERSGMVVRAPDTRDGRRVLVRLAPAGAAALAVVRRERESWMASRIAGLTSAERFVLSDACLLLERLADDG